MKLKVRLVALATVAGVVAPLAGGTAMAAPPVTALEATPDLGPTITATDQAPTGYEVTFRYEAPPGTTAVGIGGEVYFTRPTAIRSDFSHDGRRGHDWQVGDVSHPLYLGPPAQMTNIAGDLWEITMALPAGTYNYGFIVGECALTLLCTTVRDPANPPFGAGLAGVGQQSLSQVFVPSHPQFPTYDFDYQGPVRDTAQAGTVTSFTYPSGVSINPVGKHQLAVYLPPGYDAERAEPYPTLYLSHGMGDNETAWVTQGAAHHIFDNALADGDAVEAVVIMTNFNGLIQDDGFHPDFLATYTRELVDYVIPFVESQFHVSAEPEQRAFAGLSMGGALGVHLLHEHPDLFGYYGLWSAATDLQGEVIAPPPDEHLDAVRSRLGIHLGTGRHDQLARIAEKSLARTELYRALDIPIVVHNVDGGHTWAVWRQLLNDFVRTTAFQRGDEAAEPVDQSDLLPEPVRSPVAGILASSPHDGRTGEFLTIVVGAAILVAGSVLVVGGAVARRRRRHN
ncbi:MAG: hypothetical protein CVT64_06585 [Actinobacteria bacterium HGW-Actinobacteria-4]|nr:MAG: hypothetical protein CVT64_06585 [Actinobacteria bacterium HGW-Actinobacteria-4]